MAVTARDEPIEQLLSGLSASAAALFGLASGDAVKDARARSSASFGARDEHLEHPEEHHMLQGQGPSLRLSRRCLSDADVHALSDILAANTASLTALDLSHTNLGSHGACRIASSLQANRHLTELNLERALVGDVGAAALAQMLAANSTLVLLNLEQNQISDRGKNLLEEALDRNTTLTEIRLGMMDVDASLLAP